MGSAAPVLGLFPGDALGLIGEAARLRQHAATHSKGASPALEGERLQRITHLCFWFLVAMANLLASKLLAMASTQ